ncbi:MAG: hypothetical protein ABIP39_16450 [Polyangiaceae bacterium]
MDSAKKSGGEARCHLGKRPDRCLRGGPGGNRSLARRRKLDDPADADRVSVLRNLRATANDVYVIGNKGTILHRHAGSWATEASGTTNDLNDVWIHSASEIHAVGSHGLVLVGSGNGVWKADSTLGTDDFVCMFGLPFGELYAGTRTGRLFHVLRTGGSQSLTFEKAAIDGIWGDSSVGVFLVGRRL